MKVMWAHFKKYDQILELLNRDQKKQAEDVLKNLYKNNPALVKEIISYIKKSIGPSKTPKITLYFRKSTDFKLRESSLMKLGICLLDIAQKDQLLELFDYLVLVRLDSALAHAFRGDILVELGRYSDAETSIETALAIDTTLKEPWLSRGHLFFKQQRFKEAVDCYKEVSKNHPSYSGAFSNQGAALFQLKLYDEALACYQRACALSEKDANNWADNGLLLYLLNRYDDAITCYNEALEIDPKFKDVLLNKATALAALSRNQDAIDLYTKFLESEPTHSEAWWLKSNCLFFLRRYDEALISCRRALNLNQDRGQYWESCGHILMGLKNEGEALLAYDQALLLGQESAEIFAQKGNILASQKNYDEALIYHTAALKLEPNNLLYLLYKAETLFKIGHFESAQKLYEAALALDPNNFKALACIGIFFLNTGCAGKGIFFLEKAKAMEENASVLYALSLCYLATGDLEAGWELYEYRWHQPDQPQLRHQYIPSLLDKDSVAGKSILVWHEQGIGDTIQFARFAPLLVKLGAVVTFEVQPSLKTILENSLLDIQIVATNTLKAGHFDYQIPLLSLPRLFNINMSKVPPPLPIASQKEGLREKWSHHIIRNGKLNIGIVCSGNPRHAHDLFRSIPLEYFVRLSEIANLYLIQKEVRDTDKGVLETSAIFSFADMISDFEDTAAIIDLLDLVITADTAPAHFAGSMRKETWVLLPYNSEWRWQINRSDSYWYPEIYLFRQQEVGNWASVFEKVRIKLSDYAKKRASQFR